MNTILIVMVYISHNGYVPQYAVKFPTEIACVAYQKANFPDHNSVFEKKAVCLPEVVAK